jgi:hypothetical protein
MMEWEFGYGIWHGICTSLYKSWAVHVLEWGMHRRLFVCYTKVVYP